MGNAENHIEIYCTNYTVNAKTHINFEFVVALDLIMTGGDHVFGQEYNVN